MLKLMDKRMIQQSGPAMAGLAIPTATVLSLAQCASKVGSKYDPFFYTFNHTRYQKL